MANWKVLEASARGTSHQGTGLPCQDSSGTILTRDSADEDVLVVACSDGAGSAPYSDEGSRLACQTIIAAATRDLRVTPISRLDQQAIVAWYGEVRQAIEFASQQRDATPRDLAATLLVGVIGASRSVFAQVGDGAMVFRGPSGDFSPVFWPPESEYANATTFVTDASWDSACMGRVIEEPVLDLAAFSDGLQRVALHQATRTAHQPFFVPLFRRLTGVAFADDLKVDLTRFLDSPALNKRTDDDKTLVLATRREHDAAIL
jgi:hypothetical protein